MKLNWMLLMVSFSITAPVSGAQEGKESNKGYELMKEADRVNSNFLGQSNQMQMDISDAYGNTISRKMKSIVMEKKKGDKSLIEFESPADVRGTKMLTWVKQTGSDDQWLYLPAMKRVKRINSKSKTGSFMGSQFSYEDLGNEEIEKYKYSYIKEATLDGRKVHVIDRFPLDKNSGYSKQRVFLDIEYQGPLKIDYFDKKQELLKISTFSDYKRVKKWWTYHKIEMKNVQTKKTSSLTWTEKEFEVKLKESDFNSKKLEG